MKKILSLIFLLTFALGFIKDANAQFVDIGTITATTNGTTGAAPINQFYRSMHYQVVYTAAELTANGALPFDNITGLGWHVTGVPLYALPNYTIKIKHTSAVNAAVYDGVGLTTTLTLPSYAAVAGGYDVKNFNTNFSWDGTSNILIDVCFDMVTAWNSSGVQTTFAGTTSYIRSDGASQCGIATNTSNTNRPIVRLAMSGGTPPSCTPPNSVTNSNVLAYSANISWNPGAALFFLVEVGPVGFTPGSGTAVASGSTLNNTINITGLSPSTYYTAYVAGICANGDTLNYVGPTNFLTPCVTETAPYLQTFDASLTTPLCWTNTNTGNGAWNFLASGGAGPGYAVAGSVDHTSGIGNFAWMDASFSLPTNSLVSPTIDFSGLTQGVVGCWILSHNTDDVARNKLKIEAWDGTAWVNLLTYTGSFAGWKRIYALIPASIPTTTTFRMVQEQIGRAS